jgi:hypothetical protein
MTRATPATCTNPACFCQTPDGACSLWCGARDLPAGVRCLCRHEECTRPLARAPLPAFGFEGLAGAVAAAQWLLIIRRDQPGVYPAERERLVIVDRRRGDRRQGPRATPTERRREDRRQPLSNQEREQWLQAGYRVVRRPGGVATAIGEEDAASWPTL